MIGLALLLIAALIPFLLGRVLVGRVTKWSTLRIILFAAAPVPLVSVVFALLLIIGAVADHPDNLNRSDIENLAFSSIPLIIFAVVLSVFSFAWAALGVFVARRDLENSRTRPDEIFE